MKIDLPSIAFLRPLSLAFATAALTQLSHAAALSNAGFESGITGWTESGGSGLFTTASTLQGAYGSVAPTEGSSFGLISNNGVSVESVSQTFDITAGTLALNYRFLTDEHNTGADYNDFATILLTSAGNTTTLLTISRNDLQAGGEGSLLAGASFLDNTQNGFDVGQDSWRSLNFDTSSLVGQSVTLTFQVTNVGDSSQDIGVSQLAVDHVQQVPETSSIGLLAGSLLLAAARRRRP